MSIRVALYQPDIPQNTGALIRLGACFRVPIEVIEPCGFVWSDRYLRRAGMDYTDMAVVTRHVSWDAFRVAVSGRLVLLTTRGDTDHTEANFKSGDILLLGQETAGVPEKIHSHAALRVRISMVDGARSLNVALAGAMVLGEALRQVDGFPGREKKTA
tara:strand:+ start:112 stop:585 length:474 start_codon:yes stop_codon:yes gene_type:complete